MTNLDATTVRRLRFTGVCGIMGALCLIVGDFLITPSLPDRAEDVIVIRAGRSEPRNLHERPAGSDRLPVLSVCRLAWLFGVSAHRRRSRDVFVGSLRRHAGFYRHLPRNLHRPQLWRESGLGRPRPGCSRPRTGITRRQCALVPDPTSHSIRRDLHHAYRLRNSLGKLALSALVRAAQPVRPAHEVCTPGNDCRSACSALAVLQLVRQRLQSGHPVDFCRLNFAAVEPAASDATQRREHGDGAQTLAGLTSASGFRHGRLGCSTCPARSGGEPSRLCLRSASAACSYDQPIQERVIWRTNQEGALNALRR